MSLPMQSKNRADIRQSVGYNTGDVIVGTAKSTVDTSSLIDTVGLARGGDDEYNGWQVIIYNSAGGSIVDGETSIVTDFDGATKDATCSPVFTASITSTDKYELWRPGLDILQLNDKINQVIADITADCLKNKETHDTFTESAKYEYSCLSNFKAVNEIEYVYSIGESVSLHACDVVWDESVDSDVTATADTTIQKEGNGCLKLVVAAGAAANDILATEDITASDLSDCDEVEIWIRSSVALNAGDIQLLLDNTALCASPVESLNIPATTANTWTRHVITLANPENDTAIISVGLKMVTDKGAFTLYADYIIAVNSASRIYKHIPAEFWAITKASTPTLKLTEKGLSLAGSNTLLRINGYQIPTLFSDDATNADVDPAYLIFQTTADLLATNMAGMGLSASDRHTRLAYYTQKAETRLRDVRTQVRQGTRWA